MFAGDFMYFNYDIDEKLVLLANEAERELKDVYKAYEDNALLASSKILKAFQETMVSSSDFVEITGYGYSDSGRDKLENIYSKIFKAEDALVRPQIMSGTHALSLTLFGLLKHGETMISITGEPYDSLKSVIGLTGNSRNSLIADGVKYEQIELVNNDFDITTIVSRLKSNNVKLVEIQRSRVYSHREGISISQMEEIIKIIKDPTNISQPTSVGSLSSTKSP